MKAPSGAIVSIYYDSPVSVEFGHYIRTSTGRTYLVVEVRQQKKGIHRRRKHIKALVMEEGFEIPKNSVVHPLYWYPRG